MLDLDQYKANLDQIEETKREIRRLEGFLDSLLKKKKLQELELTKLVGRNEPIKNIMLSITELLRIVFNNDSVTITVEKLT
jgi:hypothetical protein